MISKSFIFFSLLKESFFLWHLSCPWSSTTHPMYISGHKNVCWDLRENSVAMDVWLGLWLYIILQDIIWGRMCFLYLRERCQNDYLAIRNLYLGSGLLSVHKLHAVFFQRHSYNMPLNEASYLAFLLKIRSGHMVGMFSESYLWLICRLTQNNSLITTINFRCF